MKELFLGNKKLFENTWIYDKWNFGDKYPVIKISFAKLDYEYLGLYTTIENTIESIAKDRNILLLKKGMKERFIELIETLGKEKPVVILIDEYDKPIIDYIENGTMKIAVENRKILKNFYSAIKDCDKSIKLIFITGISKFSKVSFFSELNNLTDITVNEKYSQITGYTEKEIIDNYSEYFVKIEQKFNIDRIKLLNLIKLWYDGYSWDGKNFIHNPYSVLNLFESLSFNNYWFNTGIPTFLTKMIREKSIDIDKFKTSFEVEGGMFDPYDITNIDINILLFQAGYLTIKEKIINPEDLSEVYKLSYPNKEVKDSFYNYLLGEFTGLDKTGFFETIKTLKAELENNNIERFILNLKTLYSDIPSEIFIKENESYYHTVIYLILKLLNANIIEVEKQTNQGRIDAVIFTKKYILLLNLK